MKRVFINYLFILGMPGLVFAKSVNLGRVTVEKTNQTVETDRRAMSLELLPCFSAEESLDYSASIDLRKRASFGLQQDLSLRGSMFEDTQITLAGAPLNDPQTGHFNLELPVPSLDLERVLLEKNRQRINFALKKPKASGGLVKVGVGEHKFKEGAFSYNFPLETALNRISAEYRLAGAERLDTDFKLSNFSYHVLQRIGETDVEFISGYNKRDFGADSFYSELYRQEEEHTTQTFFSLKESSAVGLAQGVTNIYYRRHSDEFLLDRKRPNFYRNQHTTYVYGLDSEFKFEQDLFLGVNLEEQKITSTSLNRWHRLKRGGTFGIKDHKAAALTYSLWAGIDYLDDWDYLERYSASVDYALSSDLKLNFKYDQIWRLPSFTELYYVSPANLGDPNLGVQKSHNYQTGLDYQFSGVLAGIDLFLRQQKSTIDWVKNNAFDPWQAVNVGDLDVRGYDLFLEKPFRNQLLNALKAEYTFQKLDRNNPYVYSKYLFDYNRHKIVAIARLGLKDTFFNLIGSYSRPINRKGYQLYDLHIERKIAEFLITLDINNLLNTRYQETAFYDGPGRWIKAAVTLGF